MATTEELDTTLNIRINSKEKEKFINDNEKQHAHVLRKFIKAENTRNKTTTTRRK